MDARAASHAVPLAPHSDNIKQPKPDTGFVAVSSVRISSHRRSDVLRHQPIDTFLTHRLVSQRENKVNEFVSELARGVRIYAALFRQQTFG